MIPCTCWSCSAGKPHPESHKGRFDLSPDPVYKDGKLTDQFIHYHACTTCGHTEVKQP